MEASTTPGAEMQMVSGQCSTTVRYIAASYMLEQGYSRTSVSPYPWMLINQFQILIKDLSIYYHSKKEVTFIYFDHVWYKLSKKSISLGVM
jgi:hypothetical protein